jgi:amidase
MGFKEYASFDGLGLGELVRKGEISPIELLDEAIARAEKHNPVLNAVVFKFYDQARAAAKHLEPAAKPFAGVPFLLKDILGDCAGMPTRFGSRYFPAIPAPADCELVARYKRAGLLPFGKTNVPEVGLTPFTEPQLYGPARNPWDTSRTPGGSSGGAAAVVAAGVVPLAHGNDGGGSIRIPASCCGLVGLKPTRGRNSLAPLLGDALGGLVAEHVLTRTVRDSAAALDATEGAVAGDPYVAPPKRRPYLEATMSAPPRLRIAFSARGINGALAHADCVAAVESAAKLCADLGHRVEEAMPVLEFSELALGFITLFAAGCAFTIESARPFTGQEPRREMFESLTWNLYELGTQVSAAQYLVAVATLQRASRVFAGFFDNYDVLLTPTVGNPTLKIGAIDILAPTATLSDEAIIKFVHTTPIYNITGQPAVSLPLYWNGKNLPIGVTFGGRFGDEDTLFALAAELERAQPWSNRRPPIWD